MMGCPPRFGRPREGLKHESSVHCDELVSLPKSALRQFVGTLSLVKMTQLGAALRIALDIPETPRAWGG